MRLKKLTILALGMIALGLIALLASGVGLWWTWNTIMAAGHGVTVPAAVDLDVDPANEQAVWRELAGPHITVNRPLLGPPDDLDISVIDRRTGEAIETRTLEWRVRQRVMPGFERSRRAVAAFDPPEHGEISLVVTGSFEHPQVYRVSPSVRAWAANVIPVIQIGAGAGLLLLLGGIGVLIAKALRSEREAMDRLEA